MIRPSSSAVLVEALEPRIAPAGLLNESKFTSVVVGGAVLLDASGRPGDFQGLSTAFGANAGSYLLYLTQGKALVYTTDLNGNGILDPGEITGIALGVDSQGRAPNLLIFSDIHGDLVTDLMPGHGVSTLSDSDNNPNNGTDGRLLLHTPIAGITLRTITAGDIDTGVPGNTVANRLGLTSFSIYGDIYCGGDFGGLTIDTSGTTDLTTKFNGGTGIQLFTGANPQVGGILTGTAAIGHSFHFTQNSPNIVSDGTAAGTTVTGTNVGGALSFVTVAGEHGGNISNVVAAQTTTAYSLGVLATGDGGTGAAGGNITNVIFNSNVGSYTVSAGDGGQGLTGGAGGSISGFSDLGTITGSAIVHSGTGGAGLLGAGGLGGTITFGTVKTAANVRVYLGGGGDGFTAGGDGASLPAAGFTAPEGVLPVGSKFYGTWHAIGDVGNNTPAGTDANGNALYAPHAIDFNGDGLGDAVYTATSPGQVVVEIGDGFGAFVDNGGDNTSGIPNGRIVLNTPGITNPVVTIGDFNGDGRPDIAVASNSPNNFAGVYVFLDQIGTGLDPVNSHNFSGSPYGDHPFSDALQSAVPLLSDYGVFQTSGAISALAAGDFNGDGLTDLAYVQTVTISVTLKQFDVVGILFGSPNAGVTTTATGVDGHTHVQGSGYFYPNPAAPRSASLIQFAQFPSSSLAQIGLKASSLSNNNVPDATTGLPAQAEVLFAGQNGEKSVELFSVAHDPVTHRPTTVPTPFLPALNAVGNDTSIGLGQVDTNRRLSAGTTINVSLVDATLQDYTVQDVDADGNVDLITLTKTPATFLVNFQGNGTTAGFTVASNLANPPAANDNNGVYLGVGTQAPPPTTAIATADSNGDGIIDEVFVLAYPGTPPTATLRVISLTDANGAPSFYSGGSTNYTEAFILPTLTADQAVQGIDAYYVTVPTAGAPQASDYGALSPNTSDYRFSDVFLSGDTAAAGYYLTENGYYLKGGSGGNSTAGLGGRGGVIGTSAGLLTSGATSVAITFPAYQAYQGQAYALAGNGGNGFSGGGAGGDVQGIFVRYSPDATMLTSDVALSAGNGGNGIGGDGGRGGNTANNSVESGTLFTAGNGGNGLHGGIGGGITGNTAGIFDTRATDVAAIAGFGGQGSAGGGAGGAILNFDPVLANVIGSTGGSLSYTSGAGGSAAGGGGGAGGAITNSSPNTGEDDLGGTLTLVTGNGGNGLTGGSGGALGTFINQPTNGTAVPTVLYVTTGNGGVGVSGVGGNGGSISNLSTNATGLGASGTGSDLTGTGVVIAGHGGDSYGGTGGAGGSITNVSVQTTSTPIVVAAGAGGEGLMAGGNGGSVSNSTINSAAQLIGKVLIVAGAGGDTVAASPADIVIAGDGDATDLAHAILAFGGVSGKGGNGGNIQNITQPVSTQTAVDLIAGNGGSTLNYGNSLSPVSNVGSGGSVVNITLAGTVGAISRDTTLGASTNPPIQSYAGTDPLTGTTLNNLAALINDLASSSEIGALFSLSDANGNVGLVAGVAGAVKAVNGVTQPARDGINGSVTNLSASSIMSIVAGSVDQVAPVQSISGITVTNPGGVLGADKSLAGDATATSLYGPNGRLDYINLQGQDVQSLAAGYKLIDGAIYAINNTQLAGPRVFSAST